jgi:hypothetical protein
LGNLKNLVKRSLKIVACAAKFIADSSLPVRLGAVGTTKTLGKFIAGS